MASMVSIRRIYLLEMTEDFATYVIEFTDGTAKRLTIEHTEEEEERE